MTDTKQKIRSLLETNETADGKLKDWEIHRAIYALTGQKLGDADRRLLQYELLNLVDSSPRQYHDCDSEFTERELKLIEVALMDAAGEP